MVCQQCLLLDLWESPMIALPAKQLLLDPWPDRGSLYWQSSHLQMPIKGKLYLHFAGIQQFSPFIIPLSYASELSLLDHHRPFLSYFFSFCSKDNLYTH